MPHVVDCVTIGQNILKKAATQFAKLKTQQIEPHLVIFQNNQDAASHKYVAIKVKQAALLGVKATVVKNFTTQEELIALIHKANQDVTIHGYIVQLPLPKSFDPKLIFPHIAVEKDVDGLSALAVYQNVANYPLYYPKSCTANGIMAIFAACNYSLTGKNVVLVNRSMIVGKPLISMLLTANATVTICHTKTQNLAWHTQNADVLISAIGQPRFFTKEMVKANSFVVDAGISVVNQKLCGDVDFVNVLPKVAYITPVPNGVGKLTVAMIFKNLADLIEVHHGKLS